MNKRSKCYETIEFKVISYAHFTFFSPLDCTTNNTTFYLFTVNVRMLSSVTVHVYTDICAMMIFIVKHICV